MGIRGLAELLPARHGGAAGGCAHGQAGAGGVAAEGFGHGEDQGCALGVTDALVAVDGLGVEVDGVAGVESVELAVVRDPEGAGEDAEELRAGVTVGADGAALAGGEELRDVRRDVLVGGDQAEALKVDVYKRQH